MKKMTEKKPEYGSTETGSFFGDTESFNFEEDNTDDFFAAVQSFGETERPNFEPNFSPKKLCFGRNFRRKPRHKQFRKLLSLKVRGGIWGCLAGDRIYI